jgi:hypothetical protein
MVECRNGDPVTGSTASARIVLRHRCRPAGRHAVPDAARGQARRRALLDVRIERPRRRLARSRAQAEDAELRDLQDTIAVLKASRAVDLDSMKARGRGALAAGSGRSGAKRRGSVVENYRTARIALGDLESVRHWCGGFGSNDAGLVQASTARGLPPMRWRPTWASPPIALAACTATGDATAPPRAAQTCMFMMSV